MWNSAEETWVAGSGQVYVAPVGVNLPANATSTPSPSDFVGLGYHTEDGAKTNQTIETNEFGAWQSEDPIRRSRKSSLFQIGFSLLQWNENTLPFAKGGGKINEVSANQFRYLPPTEADALEEKALLLDVDDGTRRARFFIPRGTVTDQGENVFNRDNMANLEVMFKALKPESGGPSWYVIFSNSDAFAPGS
jgi:hypothetical protein